MNRHRYDDVVKFVASVVFGSSFREFHDVIQSLEDNFQCNALIANITTMVFFAVFFRNVHGLIAYDLWADNSEYEPSFEQRPRHIVMNFAFGLLGAILLPFLFIYLLTGHSDGKSSITDPELLACLLFLPIAIYIPWNGFWLRKLRQFTSDNSKGYQRSFPPNEYFPWLSNFRERLLKQSKCLFDALQKIKIMPHFLSKSASQKEYQAYIEILNFTILWCLIDVVFVVLFYIGMWWKLPYSASDFCFLYIIIALIILVLDYFSHVEYYFPTPMRKKEFYEFGPIWEYVLPDGVKFCHWGGRESSEKLKDKLDIKVTDIVIELCCGQGGTLSLLPDAKLIVGVDKSASAIKQAKKNLKDKPIELLCVDIHHLPFPDGFFTKLFVQDGDAWMHTSKHSLMSEIYRVTAKDGVFIYQNYVCSTKISEDDSKKMDEILNKCGYPETSVPQLENISQMFQLAGFRVEQPVTDLHDMYSQDNLRMLELFEKNRQKMIEQFSKNEVETLKDLLELEKELFSKRWWSGVLVIARKD